MRTEQEYHEAYRKVIARQDSLLALGKDIREHPEYFSAKFLRKNAITGEQTSYHTGIERIDTMLARLYVAQGQLEQIMSHVVRHTKTMDQPDLLEDHVMFEIRHMRLMRRVHNTHRYRQLQKRRLEA